jgi:hypothetical protein
MATLDTTRSSAFRAASHALDDAIDATLDGGPLRPSGTTFVPADLASSGRYRTYRRLGPVSIVAPDGTETPLAQTRAVDPLALLIAVGALVWLVARLRSRPSR